MASADGFSSTVTGVSDYDFRGVSLSATDPALQASVDFAADSGFYAGAWVSNIDYGSAIDGDIELDLYGGLGRRVQGRPRLGCRHRLVHVSGQFELA